MTGWDDILPAQWAKFHESASDEDREPNEKTNVEANDAEMNSEAEPAEPVTDESACPKTDDSPEDKSASTETKLDKLTIMVKGARKIADEDLKDPSWEQSLRIVNNFVGKQGDSFKPLFGQVFSGGVISADIKDTVKEGLVTKLDEMSKEHDEARAKAIIGAMDKTLSVLGDEGVDQHETLLALILFAQEKALLL